MNILTIILALALAYGAVRLLMDALKELSEMFSEAWHCGENNSHNIVADRR
jgi:hypothetical protein